MKKTRGSVALYDPYLDVIGGGEKHILSFLKVFEEQRYKLTVFWDDDLRADIDKRFHMRFDRFSFSPNIFKRKNIVKKFFDLSKFDYFFYVTNGSYFFSSARKNYIFAMVPQKSLYSLSPFNRLKLVNASFIANSRFTQSNLRKWGIESQVVYPFVEKRLLDTDLMRVEKKKTILSVGRFFPHLHSKKIDVVISQFFHLKNKLSQLKDYRLILAGGLKKEDQGYFQTLKQSVGRDSSIVLKVNISYEELIELYQTSQIYWHFTGWGVDEDAHPEQVEHLGIAPLEAMATGCVVFCVNAGGPKEIIQDGTTGFLFQDGQELGEKMSRLLMNDSLKRSIAQSAHAFVKDNFSYQVFKNRVQKILI